MAATQTYLVFTAPVAGTYYLRMAPRSTSVAGGYRIRTRLGATGTGFERGRDHRDAFVTHSDDGVAWSSPARVNDDLPHFDNWLPEVMVAGDGYPYSFWFDWRDDTYSSRSYQYISRSGDGGDSWEANQRMTDAQNDWTAILSRLVPNQGDYSHAYADEGWLRLAWADGRGGNPDVWATLIGTRHFVACPSNTNGVPGNDVLLGWELWAQNPLFTTTITHSLSDQRGWPLPTGGTLYLASDFVLDIERMVHVPDTALAGVNQICFNATNPMGRTESCCFDLQVTPGQSAAVGERPFAFALGRSVPNPASGSARLDFTVPEAAPVRLLIYDLTGKRVRTLVDEESPPGSRSAVWDGRDDRGQQVRAGAYFCRLEGFGRSLAQRIVWLR